MSTILAKFAEGKDKKSKKKFKNAGLELASHKFKTSRLFFLSW